VKEAIFHPEARAEMREAFDFYEARLDGLGLRFLSAVEQTVERITIHPEAGAPLAGEFRKRIIPGFPYNIIYRVWEDYIYFVAVAPIVVVRAIGANEPIVANNRLKNDARRPRAS
jgi:plasmid stabilization system protein ParE